MALQELGAGVGGWIASLLAEGPASEEEKKLYDYLKQNMDEFGNIDPNVLKDVEAVVQNGTEFDKVKEDPRLKDAQMRALGQLQQVASEGGMTLMDRARLNAINSDLNQQQQARRGAMMTNAAQRGQLGSGMMYANMMSGEQAAAEAASQQGFMAAAEAQKRALDAMQRAGQMGGDIRGQDYGMARDRAGAQDSINRYNAELRNQMNRYNMDNRQQNFNNRLGLGDRRNKARTEVAGYHKDKAKNIRTQYDQAGKAIGGTLGAAGDFAVGAATGVNPGGLGSFGKGLYDAEEDKKKKAKEQGEQAPSTNTISY